MQAKENRNELVHTFWSDISKLDFTSFELHPWKRTLHYKIPMVQSEIHRLIHGGFSSDRHLSFWGLAQPLKRRMAHRVWRGSWLQGASKPWETPEKSWIFGGKKITQVSNKKRHRFPLVGHLAQTYICKRKNSGIWSPWKCEMELWAPSCVYPSVCFPHFLHKKNKAVCHVFWRPFTPFILIWKKKSRNFNLCEFLGDSDTAVGFDLVSFVDFSKAAALILLCTRELLLLARRDCHQWATNHLATFILYLTVFSSKGLCHIWYIYPFRKPHPYTTCVV